MINAYVFIFLLPLHYRMQTFLPNFDPTCHTRKLGQRGADCSVTIPRPPVFVQIYRHHRPSGLSSYTRAAQKHSSDVTHTAHNDTPTNGQFCYKCCYNALSNIHLRDYIILGAPQNTGQQIGLTKVMLPQYCLD